jgi:hypothetical protein
MTLIAPHRLLFPDPLRRPRVWAVPGPAVWADRPACRQRRRPEPRRPHEPIAAHRRPPAHPVSELAGGGRAPDAIIYSSGCHAALTQR